MENKNNNALPEMATAILNSLSAMNAEFSFDFDNIEVKLPTENPNQPASLRVNGSLRIRTKSHQNQS